LPLSKFIAGEPEGVPTKVIIPGIIGSKAALETIMLIFFLELFGP